MLKGDLMVLLEPSNVTSLEEAPKAISYNFN